MAEFFKFYNSKPNLKFLKKTADILEDGGLIIYPTDTVYALGCLSNNKKAIQRLADIKKIKLDKASFSFFIISNLGVWFFHYPHTFSGLLTCFTLAIPFFVNSLAGDLFYSSILDISVKKLSQPSFFIVEGN